MKVGDLINCGDETALVLDATWTNDYPQVLWLECLWCNGDVEAIEAGDVELASESR
jgi:hypothetical protein